MPRMITLGAAQTGPVNEDHWRPNVPGACAMIVEAGAAPGNEIELASGGVNRTSESH